jgi:GTP pyrophosphokinase
VPGDKILGFISRGRGVAVHRADCPNMRGVDDERLIEVKWASSVSTSFDASVRVLGDDQGEILSCVSGLVAQMGFSITAINGRIDAKTKSSIVDFNIRLSSLHDLDLLIKKIKLNGKIIDAYRTST